LFYGGRLVVVPYLVSRSPEAFYRLLEDEKVTVLNQTPAAFRQLIQVEEASGASDNLALRYVIFGGEALELNSLKPWFGRHGDQCPQLVNMYGITETTVHVTYRPVSAADLQGGSVIGVPIPDLQVHLLDARQQLVPIGVPGEMYVGGDGLGRGYFNRADLTAEKFVRDPFRDRPGARLYRSGDLARRLPNGDLEYLGRIDFQVKIRGFRVELGEIEAAINSHPAVHESTVLVREDRPGDQRLVGYLVMREQAVLSVAELREHLKKALPDYMVPAVFVRVEKLPLTASGKVDRRALAAPDQNELSATEYEPPGTPVEEKLASIWADVLGVERVGRADNFFERGGHSLLGTKLMARVRGAFQQDVPLRVLFENPTVKGLATAIEKLQPPTGGDHMEQLLAELEGLSEEEAAARLNQISSRQDG
jgi:acyl-coenzyme A synthetase/AMP-(fatty) acid ligase